MGYWSDGVISASYSELSPGGTGNNTLTPYGSGTRQKATSLESALGSKAVVQGGPVPGRYIHPQCPCKQTWRAGIADSCPDLCWINSSVRLAVPCQPARKDLRFCVRNSGRW